MCRRLAALTSLTLLFGCLPDGDTAAHAQATIEVGAVLALAGQRVRLEVRLRSHGLEVVGTQNDLRFDPLTPVAVRPGAVALPDCRLSAFVPLGGGSVVFRTTDCVPPNCPLRALVLALDTVEPIADGSVLYTCTVEVAASAAQGTYPVRCSNPGATDPAANTLIAECVDGAIEVVAELPTPTVTATPTVTRTQLPPTRTRVPTITRTPTVTGTPCDPACAAVHVGSVSGRPGERVRFSARFENHGHQIGGLAQTSDSPARRRS